VTLVALAAAPEYAGEDLEETAPETEARLVREGAEQRPGRVRTS